MEPVLNALGSVRWWLVLVGGLAFWALSSMNSRFARLLPELEPERSPDEASRWLKTGTVTSRLAKGLLSLLIVACLVVFQHLWTGSGVSHAVWVGFFMGVVPWSIALGWGGHAGSYRLIAKASLLYLELICVAVVFYLLRV